MIITINFVGNPRIGSVQRELLALLKQKPMLGMDLTKSQRRAAVSLYFNGLIGNWENEWEQPGYQITDKGRKVLED